MLSIKNLTKVLTISLQREILSLMKNLIGNKYFNSQCHDGGKIILLLIGTSFGKIEEEQPFYRHLLSVYLTILDLMMKIEKALFVLKMLKFLINMMNLTIALIANSKMICIMSLLICLKALTL